MELKACFVLLLVVTQLMAVPMQFKGQRGFKALPEDDWDLYDMADEYNAGLDYGNGNGFGYMDDRQKRFKQAFKQGFKFKHARK